MKSFFLKSTVLTLVLIFTSLQAYCQIFEVPLEERIHQSDLVVEGKVISSKSFLNTNNRIFTANEIEISKILKGRNFQNTTLTVITRGGEYNGLITTWTHLLSLAKNETGIFCLKELSDEFSTNGNFQRNQYSVIASSQGFIKYLDDTEGVEARDNFNTYKSIGVDLLSRIEEITNQPIINLESTSFDKENCLFISIEPAFTDIIGTIGAEIKIKTLEDAIQLYKSKVVIKYDTDILGENIVSNGVLTMVNQEISLLDSYQLTATDLEENLVEIDLEFVGEIDELFTVTSEKSSLGKAIIQINDINELPQINLEYDLMEGENQYFNEETQRGEPFRCIKIESDFFQIAAPQIDFFLPPIAAAGVGSIGLDDASTPGIITIFGDNFGTPLVGENKPSHMKLGFTNAGSSSATWCFPPEEDIISWNDSTVVVRVPSLNEDGTVTTYSGTGVLLMWNMMDTIFAYSSDELYVPYCAMNLSKLNPVTDTRKSFLIKMQDKNDNGGYNLYFGDTILTNINNVEKSFTRALDTWRCQSKVNFIVKDKSEISNLSDACLIDMDVDLPTGIFVTLGVTRRTPETCDSDTLALIPKFDMMFSKYYKKFADSMAVEINWYTEEDELPDSLDVIPIVDFETVALHELGHASMLLHTRNAGNVMYRVDEDTKRELQSDDLNGGVHCVNLSVVEPHCADKMKKYVCTTDVTETNDEQNFVVFPNPTENNIHIEFQYPYSGQVIIYDLLGKKVVEEEFKESLHKTIELRNAQSGIYVLTLVETATNQIISQKIIVK